MAIPSGLSAQLGLKSETIYGTGVVVDKFPPFVSESVKQEIARLESQGIRAGRRVRHTWKPGGKTISGSINMELTNKPLATILTHVFGGVNTTGAGPYVHTYTPGDLTGKSLTVQIGRPDTSGTVQPFTYTGCKFPSGSISCSVGQIALLTLNISAQAETTATALATATYLTGISPFVFTEAALSIAGSPIAVISDMNLDWDSGLKVDRFGLGSAVINQQVESGLRNYGGSLTADFVGLTDYNRFVSGTEAALVLNFTSGADSLVITTNARFDGDTPNVSGMEMLTQSIPFVCTSGTSDAAAITAVLTSTEVLAT